MENKKIEVELLDHTFLKKYDGKFDKKTAIEYSARIAGECYEPEGWSKLVKENSNKSEKRADLTLGLEHATPYEHINVGFEIRNLSKMMAMVLNNEGQYTTSEKSARYTEIDPEKDSAISPLEGKLYKKWLDIFTIKIRNQYGTIHNDAKVIKLAQENARYMVTSFASTKMIHTLPWVQLNRIASYMQNYIDNNNKTEFDERLCNDFKDFIACLDELNLLEDRAMSNRKNRKLSLFANREVENSFGSSYSTNYKGSFAQLAQAQRHRTLNYGMKFLDEKEFFVPPILLDDKVLVDEWLNDINSVSYATPQGELVSINECGTYDNFILKTKERLCSAAQLEINDQTKETLEKYKAELISKEHDLADDISLYSNGARCTFPDYNCPRDCKFAEAKILTRKI